MDNLTSRLHKYTAFTSISSMSFEKSSLACLNCAVWAAMAVLILLILPDVSLADARDSESCAALFREVDAKNPSSLNFLSPIDPAATRRPRSRASTASQLNGKSTADRLYAELDLRPLEEFPIQESWYHGSRYFPNVERWAPAVIKGLSFNGHIIEVMAGATAGLEANIEGVSKMLVKLPAKNIFALNKVRLNLRESKHDDYFRRKFADFRASGATARSGEIDIYKVSLGAFLEQQNAEVTQKALHMIRHEFGHNLAHYAFGSADPPVEYGTAMRKDKSSVSKYGDNSIREDFAEAVEEYLRTHAGQFIPEVREKLANRFSFIDPYFTRSPQSEEAQHLRKFWVDQLDSAHVLVLNQEAGMGLLIDITE